MSKPNCGIVMPISPIEDCDAQHWQDVKAIIEEAIIEAGYEPRLVSLSDKVSIIHQSIVTNLYEDEIVVCDVSCRNGNVMFELGLRLAFDKPVIIIKDDKTDYLFDTGPIEHMIYPRTLRFGQINKFKKDLTKKIIATTDHHRKNPDASPFLASFGPIKTAKIETKEVSAQDLAVDMLSKISLRIDSLESMLLTSPRRLIDGKKSRTKLRITIPGDVSDSDISKVSTSIQNMPFVSEYRIYGGSDVTFFELTISPSSTRTMQSIERIIRDRILTEADLFVSEVDVL